MLHSFPQLKRIAEQLARRLGDRCASTAVKLALDRAPDERLALAFVLKLSDQSLAGVEHALADSALAGDLIFCLGSSEPIGNELGAIGDEWLDFFARARAATERSLLETMHLRAPPGDRREAARALSDFKRREFVRIAIADLLDRLDVAATMRAMSQLADECIAAALAAAARLMGVQAGVDLDFCVLAMGKLGVRELNLSSDLDLVYLFNASDPSARQEQAARLGELVTELLSADCFRIDLRLRPGGRNAPIVASLEAALSFYQDLGQTWERAALLRAREVAGALDLGRRFRTELERFIYRRYLDFDTIRQLRAMKRRIEEELRTPDAIRRNIKLGRGGIRELEFIVHALTLVYAGRDPRLRNPRTIEALDRLASLGYLEADRARELQDAYLFLRDVEHKLQGAAGLQVHTLPADEGGTRALAARMGFGKGSGAAARFQAALGERRERVAALFGELLASGDQRATPAASAQAQAAWRAAPVPKAAAPALAALGFVAAEESAGHLAALSTGPAHAPASPRRRELLDRLGPHLLDEMSGLADPDLVLQNLAAFMAAVGARTSFLALLEQHPATRRVLLRLFASSRYLSTIFIRHPDLLDTLMRSDLARPRRTAPALEAELGELLDACADFEDRLNALRSFRHQEFLRIAIADLAGDLELEGLETELSALAEVVARRALEVALIETARLVMIPPTLKLCALAMGRLGAREMTYNSDLDLIFVYQDQGEIAASGREPATKIVQRLITVLEARTADGYAYKIDLRLRPSGYAGPLVASLQGFRDYHRQSSAVWERQALVRGRVIAGDEALSREVEALRTEFVFGRGLNAEEVAEIAAMRGRMEREIGAEDKHRLNIKQGPGGLVDVEFIAQMLALRYGARFAELRCRATVDLLRAAARCDLIEGKDARELEEGYGFLSRLENRLRIDRDQPAWALPTGPLEMARIARRMGYGGADGGARLLAALQHQRAQIRAIFDKCFSSV